MTVTTQTMRRTVPPVARQADPDGYVSTRDVWTQVGVWYGTGQAVSDAVARLVASYWQSSGPDGSALAAFVSSGEITDELSADLNSACRWALGREVLMLQALVAYVAECTVVPYVVTHHAPGYLPECDPYAYTLDYAAARDAWRDMMTEAGDILMGDAECSCADDSGELCPPCLTDALGRSHANDHGLPRQAPDGPAMAPDGTGTWDYAVTLAPQDEPTHARVFAIGRTMLRAADFFVGAGTPLPDPDAAPTGTGATVAGAA